jgi:hypothetical protein
MDVGVSAALDVVACHGQSDRFQRRLSDFNAGLLDYDLSPSQCYRCVESLAKVVTGAERLSRAT